MQLCDYLPQEFGRTNHNTGLFLLCNLLNHPRLCFDQSEYRFVPLLLQTTLQDFTYKLRKVSIFTRPLFPCRGRSLGRRLRISYRDSHTRVTKATEDDLSVPSRRTIAKLVFRSIVTESLLSMNCGVST